MKLSDIDLLQVGHSIQMAGAVYAGEGMLFLAMLPEERGQLLRDVLFENDTGVLGVQTLDMDQEDWTRFLRQTDLLETEVHTRGPVGKAIVRKSQRQISQGTSWIVYKRDGYRCRYCAADDVPLTVDHLVLWEEGGPSTKENLVSACRRCNKTRGNTQYADWLEHPYYRNVSRKLTPATRDANRALVSTLGTIPRTVHQPSHR